MTRATPWVAAALLLAATGCVKRSLTITSDPPGALAYVNDQLKGPTPVTYDFVWYGWHRVMLRKDGYQRLDDRKMLRAPVHLWIPLDFVMELLPFQIRDRRTWAYRLTPSSALPAPTPPSLPGHSAEPGGQANPGGAAGGTTATQTSAGQVLFPVPTEETSDAAR